MLVINRKARVYYQYAPQLHVDQPWLFHLSFYALTIKAWVNLVYAITNFAQSTAENDLRKMSPQKGV
jgi:hypothetical protein